MNTKKERVPILWDLMDYAVPNHCTTKQIRSKSYIQEGAGNLSGWQHRSCHKIYRCEGNDI